MAAHDAKSDAILEEIAAAREERERLARLRAAKRRRRLATIWSLFILGTLVVLSFVGRNTIDLIFKWLAARCRWRCLAS
jgi:hypothetical protein